MSKKFSSAAFAGILMGVMALLPVRSQAAEQIRIGQATPALSFMPLYAARALGTFDKEGATLRWASISGGDPSALAALDAGDIDFAAVGSDTVLNAIAAGQPFQIVYSLMSRVTLQLVVSDAFLKRAGLTPSSPLKKRIAALKNATIGVSAIGGAQDRVLRWLAKQGGVNPKTELKVAQVGPPPALQAALENNRIDGFLLSPPQGYIAASRKYGRVLIDLGKELPQLRGVPFLVLVAKTPLSEKSKQMAVTTVKAMKAATATLMSDTSMVADKIQKDYFAKASKAAIEDGIENMKAGLAGNGRLTPEGMTRLAKLSEETGVKVPKNVAADGSVWTNAYVTAAGK